MISKDKTREKLVASMRKSKNPADEQTNTPAKGAETKSTQASDRAVTNTARAATRVSQSGSSRSGDPYQSGNRVWPD